MTWILIKFSGVAKNFQWGWGGMAERRFLQFFNKNNSFFTAYF